MLKRFRDRVKGWLPVIGVSAALGTIASIAGLQNTVSTSLMPLPLRLNAGCFRSRPRCIRRRQ